MKNITRGISAGVYAVALFALPALVQAQFTYTTNNGAITITGYSGSGLVTIPSYINGYPVTSVGDRAFYNCTFVTGVIIPDAVTNLGYMAFCYCQKLSSITIPDGVTSMGDHVFEVCGSLRSVNIPKSLTYVPSFAFYGCTSLSSVLIPTNITSIAQTAFGMCSGLTNITLPKSIATMGSSAFYGCSGLKSVVIPSGITAINDDTFHSCSGLTNVTFPNTLTTIGILAFAECSSLTTLIIPSSVTAILPRAFAACAALTGVYYQGYVPYVDSSAFYQDYNAVFYYPPHITGQPQGRTNSLQTTAALTVTVTGTPPLAYQWQFNGTDLQAATNNTLIFQNVLLANSGVYTVTITNTYGSVTSNPAMLTVLPLVITGPSMLPNGQCQLGFDSAVGVNYQIQYSADLQQWLPWVTLGGNGSHLTVMDPNTAFNLRRFYRVSLSPQ